MKEKVNCEASFGTIHVASSTPTREIWPNLIKRKEKKKEEQPGWKKKLSAVGKWARISEVQF